MPITLNEELSYLPGGYFTCDKEKNLLQVNRELLSLLRCQSTEQLLQLTGGGLIGLVHPDDRERVALVLEESEQSEGIRIRDLEFRLKTADATIRYVGCYVNHSL